MSVLLDFQNEEVSLTLVATPVLREAVGENMTEDLFARQARLEMEADDVAKPKPRYDDWDRLPGWVHEQIAREDWEAFVEWKGTPHGGEIANLFMRYSLQMKDRGWEHYGAYGVLERLRWEQALKHGPSEADDGRKVNNNFRKRLAIWAMIRNPRLEGFFQLRTSAHSQDVKDLL